MAQPVRQALLLLRRIRIFGPNSLKMKHALLLTLAFLFAAACGAQPLRLAVYQYADNPRVRNLEPLARHLGRQLGTETTVHSYPNVQAMIRGLQAGEVDLGFISTFGYLLLTLDSTPHPMQPLCALGSDAPEGQYRTAVVARRSTGFTRLSDLAEKSARPARLALVAPGSTSGNLVPRLLLAGAGIGAAEAHFASVRYAGTHARALELLRLDSADVAAMGSAEWDRLAPAARKDLVLLQLSGDIPLGPALINRQLPEAIRAQVLALLLDLHRSNTGALGALKAAWTEARNADRFVPICPRPYRAYLQGFGSEAAVEALLRTFAR
ncbi:MAG: hypothetical protein EOO11_00590 [Chitinophagaceae bacterium]|nr:MAG: hypothetical protein EOO11_00590 [Chitinophagaceae bacterium]